MTPTDLVELREDLPGPSPSPRRPGLDQAPRRLCPEIDCRRRIPRAEFACKWHWNVLQPSTQVAINRAYRDWCDRPSPDTAKALEAAQAVAILELS